MARFKHDTLGFVEVVEGDGSKPTCRVKTPNGITHTASSSYLHWDSPLPDNIGQLIAGGHGHAQPMDPDEFLIEAVAMFKRNELKPSTRQIITEMLGGAVIQMPQTTPTLHVPPPAPAPAPVEKAKAK